MIRFARRHSGPIVFIVACLYALAMCSIHQHYLDQLYAHVAELERACRGMKP